VFYLGEVGMCRTVALCLLSSLLLPAGLLLAAPKEAGPETPPRHAVPDGLVIERVAGEPQVRFPMFAASDDRGRLFVAESSGPGCTAPMPGK
jgi:hypothetical protein